MYYKTLTILLLFLSIYSGNTQSSKINIKSDRMTETNYLQMDDFYLTHYLYIDLFLRESLFVNANVEEVSNILEAIKKFVSEGHPLEIEIEKPGKNNYRIKMVVFKKDDNEELLIAFTNWNPNKKIFEKEFDIKSNNYTRWYFLNDSKMTYRKDMSDQNNYSEMKENDLANAYLFDEVIENDEKIKPIIDKLLTMEDLEVKDKVEAHLILLKYYILKGETERITEEVDYLKQEFALNFSSDLKGLKMAFEATEFQIELMK